MRLDYIVLLTVAAFLADVNAAAARSEIIAAPATRILARSLTAGRSDAPIKSLLKVRNDDNEERGITAAGDEELTNALKSKVSTQQLEGWLKGGQSTDDVFKLLTLDNAADDILANSQFQAWIDYMKLFNKENPKSQTTLIKTLTAHYGDDGLAKIIESAKQVPATAKRGTRLQTEQIHLWLAQEKTPDNVFSMMKLDKAGAELFKQPQAITWAKYVDAFNKANPDKKTTLFLGLTTYDEETLVNMLIAAKKIPSTEDIAIRVQADLTQLWLKKLNLQLVSSPCSNLTKPKIRFLTVPCSTLG